MVLRAPHEYKKNGVSPNTSLSTINWFEFCKKCKQKQLVLRIYFIVKACSQMCFVKSTYRHSLVFHKSSFHSHHQIPNSGYLKMNEWCLSLSSMFQFDWTKHRNKNINVETIFSRIQFQKSWLNDWLIHWLSAKYDWISGTFFSSWINSFSWLAIWLISKTTEVNQFACMLYI